MSFRSYTFLPPLQHSSRERNLSFNEEEFAAKSDLIKTQPVNCPWLPDSSCLEAMPDKELILSPGNILDERNTWRKGNETAPEELFESLKSCLAQKRKDEEANVVANGSNLEVRTIGLDRDAGNENAVSAQRSDLKITGKIFLYSLNPDDISCAIEQALKSTGTDFLDSLVVSICGEVVELNRLSVDVVKQVWLVLEEAVKSKSVNMIGLCDIDPQLFIQLYEWANIKPNIVQINLASCCVVPPELAAFTKDHGIQLLTHSDPLNILPKDKLEALSLLMENGDEGKYKWENKWIMRYQVHVKCRGVLETKGYVVAIKSET